MDLADTVALIRFSSDQNQPKEPEIKVHPSKRGER
jgi:hypothetical protein